MTDAGVEEIRKHVRVYVAVFVALMALTIVTVAVSFLRLTVPAAVTVALMIAAIKGSLVAGFFMHLISERKLIYWTLLLTASFLIGLFFLPLLGYMDRVTSN